MKTFFNSKTPIIGYRGWAPHSHYLTSLNNPIYWPVNEPFKAKCTRLTPNNCSTLVPCSHCYCGIYAFKNITDVWTNAKASYAILGAVSLWGKVIECDFGYKAEFAYPYKLYKPPAEMSVTIDDKKYNMFNLTQNMSNIYGVEVDELSNEEKQIFYNYYFPVQNIQIGNVNVKFNVNTVIIH